MSTKIVILDAAYAGIHATSGWVREDLSMKFMVQIQKTSKIK